MLFNSYGFIFAFLPISLAGFFLAGLVTPRAGVLWLVVCSLVFYGLWNISFMPFLLGSIAVNYKLSRVIQSAGDNLARQNWLLGIGIGINLLALCYFKYFALIVTTLFPQGIWLLDVKRIVLPLGISFFTLTQIGYLIDTKQGISKYRGLTSYSLFVTFFPHLIAGPILHNREMMPQFEDRRICRFSSSNLAVGLTIFGIGLLKKCILADPNAAVVEPAFAHPETLQFLPAWGAALSYQFQIYFDFSGYSDMAIGLARMFNVSFPANFDSPYKSASIIEFWQRWHMTLSRYLTLYLFSPIALAVSRWRAAHGLGTTKKAQRTLAGYSGMIAFPTLATMGIAGVWHGAGLQFLIFGLLHGIYLCINHAARTFSTSVSGKARPAASRASIILKVAITFLAALVAIIFFRAPSAHAALQLLSGMIGLNGIGVIAYPPASAPFFSTLQQPVWLCFLAFIVFALPNTQQIMRLYEPVLGKVTGRAGWVLLWRPTATWAAVLGALVGVALGIFAYQPKVEFLYFQF